MSRPRALIGLLAGVALVATASAEPKDAKPRVKSSQVAKHKTGAKVSTKTKRKKPREMSLRQLQRVAARGDNMPRGFAWPPTAAMVAAGKGCEAELDAAGIAWDRTDREGRISDPITLQSFVLGGVTYRSKWRRGPHRMDCQLALALAQIGDELYQLGVREVVFGSIYRFTQVRTQGTVKPFLSRHALGLAMDIVELVDEEGRVANVKADYLNGDELLLGVENLVNGSGKFRIVLTPRNDPKSHYDHFHIEAAVDYSR